MSAPPDPGDTLRSRVLDALARREAALAETASAWARFARDQGWTASDLEALWDGLTEDLIRRYARARAAAEGETARKDVLATMGALRARILKDLGG